VAGIGTIVVEAPEGDKDDYLATHVKLIAAGTRTLFTGHGPQAAAAVERLRELVDHRLWREGRILEAWQDGVREPEAMLPRVYDDAPEAAWPLAERQIVAHLERLRRRGLIQD
jgi:glyoxylase-like metal-dependent hydrolase (beta-lactamase superfamily II)